MSIGVKTSRGGRAPLTGISGNWWRTERSPSWRGGLYACPKQTEFGKAPAADDKLVEAFLKDDRFLLASPNAYNGLGVGTTQLYDKTVVYNHKRHGNFALGGRMFEFRAKPSFPKTLSKEFLLVDLVNNLDRLAESKAEVLARVRERAASMMRPACRAPRVTMATCGRRSSSLRR